MIGGQRRVGPGIPSVLVTRPPRMISPCKACSNGIDMYNNGHRPRMLISNDDGINAPGLRALVAHLAKADLADIHVCAPSSERSAQSHAITLGRYLQCYSADVPGAVKSFAVDGTPADAVMLALNSPVFEGIRFDLVASGINRGDNCGLHVIYSGTVGAAREAACKGIPAIALSLADHSARSQEQYETSATLAVSVIQAMIGVIQAGAEHHQQAFAAGTVVNINFPSRSVGPVAGVALTHQGNGCVFPKFLEVTEPAGPHLPEIDEHTPNLRVFRNYAGEMRETPAVPSQQQHASSWRALLKKQQSSSSWRQWVCQQWLQ
eukprot:GHUV01008051.1.p1 GENE.GHUV01008051.1~~GHUV01008051.1.p1  ORF type:complete len:320 (+),score=57.49 GHUV01008051.1:218-1177(+)